MVRRFRERICSLITLKRLVYLISPNNINKSFYTDLDKVLSFKNVKFFQLRLKNVNQKRILNISKKIIKITTKHKVKFVINDYFILASKIRADEIFNLYKTINLTPSLYLKSGAIHGCVLCTKEKPLVFFEDVGRHNAIDKLAGFMFINKIDSKDKVLYTTGRLTSEMVIKSVMMEIPIIASRSGFTAWAVELAKKSNLTMIGRLRGRKYTVLSGYERLIAE